MTIIKEDYIQLSSSDIDYFPLVGMNDVSVEINGITHDLAVDELYYKYSMDISAFDIATENWKEDFVNDINEVVFPWFEWYDANFSNKEAEVNINLTKYNKPELTDSMQANDTKVLIRSNDLDVLVMKDVSGDLLYTFCQSYFIKQSIYLANQGVPDVTQFKYAVEERDLSIFEQVESCIGMSVNAQYDSSITYTYFKRFADRQATIDSPRCINTYTINKVATLQVYDTALKDADNVSLNIGICSYANSIIYFDYAIDTQASGFYSPGRMFGIGMNMESTLQIHSDLKSNLDNEIYAAYITITGAVAKYMQPNADTFTCVLSFINSGNKFNDYYNYVRPTMSYANNSIKLQTDLNDVTYTVSAPDPETGEITVEPDRKIVIKLLLPHNNKGTDNTTQPEYVERWLEYIGNDPDGYIILRKLDYAYTDNGVTITPPSWSTYTYSYFLLENGSWSAQAILGYAMNCTLAHDIYLLTTSSEYRPDIQQGNQYINLSTAISYRLYTKLPFLKNSATNNLLPFNCDGVHINITSDTLPSDTAVSLNTSTGMYSYKDSGILPANISKYNYRQAVYKTYALNYTYYEYCTVPFVAYGVIAQQVTSTLNDTKFMCTGITDGLHDNIARLNIMYNKQVGVTEDKQASVLFKDVLNIAEPNKLTCKYVEVNDPLSYNENSMSTVGEILTDTEFQFLKQQWETTDKIENYWFINSKGDMLVLDKYSIYVMRKSVDVDDWNGNEYIKSNTAIKSRDVLNYINGLKVVKYGVTNVSAKNVSVSYEPVAYMWAITFDKDNSFYLHILDINDDNSFMSIINTFELNIIHKDLNENTADMLIADTLNMYTYSTLNVSDFIYEAIYSSTCINNSIIFGIHIDNNMNQWAVHINMSTLQYFIIQGYGFVGVDGTLTGGEIPTDYFDSTKGFSSKVYPYTYLKKLYKTTGEDNKIADDTEQELYVLPTCCVGTDSKQVYIQKQLNGIVSHLKYVPATQSFDKVVLYLNNNYDCCYASSSVYTRFISDIDVKYKRMADIFTDFIENNATATTINNILTASTLMPILWALMPRINLLGYLQQTLGQYAYVHYNATENYIQSEANDNNALEDMQINVTENTKHVSVSPVAQDELSFNTQVIQQSADTSDFSMLPWLLTIAITSGASLLDGMLGAVESTLVNAIQGQSAVYDTGRKYQQQFLENVSAATVGNIPLKSLVPSMTSTVTGKLTLDMFYSTSDKQQVHAGPGYVNHNFVSQCIAQSVTSNHIELNQVTVRTFLRHLTFIVQDIEIVALQKALYALEGSLNVSNSGKTIFSTGTSAGILVACVAVQVLLATAEFFNNICKNIFEALGGDKIYTELTAAMSKHNYDIEGKHKYGSKSESFMYPCWGCQAAQTYSNESVSAQVQTKYWSLKQDTTSDGYKNVSALLGTDTGLRVLGKANIQHVTDAITDNNILFKWHSDKIPYSIAACMSKDAVINNEPRCTYLPDDMAYICGADSFLADTAFRNENIDCGNPVFPIPIIQDYIIDKTWELSQTATNGATAWLACKDTKLIDGEPSNIVVTTDFCGVASPYAAIEIRRGISEQYIRPTLLTPEVLALNNTGKNVIYDKKLYHGFDGIGYRYVAWNGNAGMNKEFLNYSYCFQVNDKLKRSNKLPANQLIGNFDSAPIVAVPVDSEDSLYNEVAMPAKGQNLEAGVIGEYKDVIRYAIPVFSEFVSTLPAAVKTLSTYHLAVVDGVTSLCTDLRNTQSAYKVPESFDFVINRTTYRMTHEYICQIDSKDGVFVSTPLVPTLGLKYLGSTPFEAYLYSENTRQYYTYSGGTALQKVDMIERFYDITTGKYDYVEQEVIARGVDYKESNLYNGSIPMTFKNNVVAHTIDKGGVSSISNATKDYKIYSLPSGIVFQGPRRCVIPRFIYNKHYMEEGVLANRNKWKVIDVGNFGYNELPPTYVHDWGRDYTYKYNTDSTLKQFSVCGWVHNPFILYTMPFGVDINTDCMFEWVITFSVHDELASLALQNNRYAQVNICAETFSTGGHALNNNCKDGIQGKYSRPMHVYLTQDLFDNNIAQVAPGYYSVRFNSNNGAGNRERLFIWSDSPIAISGIQCEYKVITTNRQTKFTQQLDINKLEKF